MLWSGGLLVQFHFRCQYSANVNATHPSAIANVVATDLGFVRLTCKESRRIGVRLPWLSGARPPASRRETFETSLLARGAKRSKHLLLARRSISLRRARSMTISSALARKLRVRVA
jgi:hypothetical protein